LFELLCSPHFQEFRLITLSPFPHQPFSPPGKVAFNDLHGFYVEDRIEFAVECMKMRSVLFMAWFAVFNARLAEGVSSKKTDYGGGA